MRNDMTCVLVPVYQLFCRHFMNCSNCGSWH